MAGGVGHTGGLTNPRPWRGRCRAGYSITGGPPLALKEGAFTKLNEMEVSIETRNNQNIQLGRIDSQYPHFEARLLPLSHRWTADSI